MATPRRRESPTTGSTGPLIFLGTMTWKPRVPCPAPSAWMEMDASALARLAMAARSVMHGPTPLLSSRVSLTVAPWARSSLASRVATSQANADSG